MKSLDDFYSAERAGNRLIEIDPSDKEMAAFECAFYDTSSTATALAFRKHTKKYTALIRNDKLPPDVDREIAVRVFFEVSMKSWRNVSLDGTTELPFTADNAVVLFKKYPRMFTFVVGEAQKDANFKIEEDDIKN